MIVVEVTAVLLVTMDLTQWISTHLQVTNIEVIRQQNAMAVLSQNSGIEN